MITTSSFVFEFLMTTEHSAWRRSDFKCRPDVFGISENPDDLDMAREMLTIHSHRFRPGTRFRLVCVTEEVFDGDDEIVSIEHGR